MGNQLRYNGLVKMAVAAILLLWGVFAGAFFYQRQSSENMLAQVRSTLAKDVVRQARSLQMVLEGQYDLLDYFASFYATRPEFRSEPELQLRLLIRPTSFYNVGIALPGGQTYSVRGINMVPQELGFFRKSMKSERGLEWILSEGEKRLALSVPLFTDGQIRGVLFGVLREASVKILINAAKINEEGCTLLCASDGEILVSDGERFLGGDGAPGEGTNFISSLPALLKDDLRSAERLRRDFRERRSGMTSHTLPDGLWYAFYTPIGLNDWIAVSEVPMLKISSMLDASNDYAGRAMLIILAVWAAVFFIFYRKERRHIAKLQRQQELMKIREDEYRIVVSQSGAMLFRFDVGRREILLEAETAELLGLPRLISGVPDGPGCAQKVAADSRADYVKFWNSLIGGAKTAHATVRMRRKDGKLRWYALSGTNIFNSEGAPVQAIASFSDVTEQREKEVIYRRWRQSLEERSPEEYTLFECNLTRDEPEIHEGTLLHFNYDAQSLDFDMRTLEYAQRFVGRDDQTAYLDLVNRDKLLANYFRGVRTASLVYREHDPEGRIRWIRLSVQMVEYPDSSDVKVYLYYRDIDRDMKRELSKKALTQQDPLTRALNRQSFEAQTDLLLSESRGAEQFAFILIDYDNFRNLNSLLGHDSGDRILTKTASDLKSLIRPGDLLGRVGGDEFMLCLKYVPYHGVVDKKAEQFCALLRRDLDQGLSLTASLGVAMAPRDGACFETLFQCADVALSHAKKKGGGRVVFYRSAMAYEDVHKDLAAVDSDRLLSTPLSESGPARPDVERPCMLVLDACPENMREMADCLCKDFTVLSASSEKEAFAQLELQPDRIKAVLANANADPRGEMALLRRVLSGPAGDSVAVLVAVTPDQAEYAMKAMELGASDFVVLSLTEDRELHLARRRLALLRIQNAMRHGGDRLNAQYRYLLYRRNEENLMQQRLRYVSEHDGLTDICNRTAFFRLAQELLGKSRGRTYALARFDINRFKVINDIFGHEEGDRLLRYLAQALKKIVGDAGVCCRTDADNFAFCVPYSEEAMQELISGIEQSIQNYDLPFELFISMGIYVIDDPSVPVDSMLDRASLAQRSVKGSAVKRFAYYEEDMRSMLLHEQEIEGDMNAALEERQFLFYLQPLFSASPERPMGAEALVRWNHPRKGLIAPGSFVPIFERNGFIMKLDRYVWEEVCRYLSERLRRGGTMLPVSVNMSRHNVYDPALCDRISELVKKYGVPPSLIKFEITESIFTENPAKLAELVARLQKMGFQVVMDDFGSGYSSLNALKDLPVDVLKIDKSFIDHIETVERSRNVLGCIVYLARRLDIPVVAEGVEREEQLRFLRSVGCGIIQGYYFSKPLPVDEFNRLIDDCLAREKSPGPQAPAPAAQAPGNPRVLVVDDSAVNRLLLSGMLKEDYQILQAGDGQAAWEFLKASPLSVDLILLDVVMPRMNGYDFLTKVRGDKDLPPYPIIVMTEAENAEAEVMALELGANDFLKKPYDAASIRLRIKNLLSLRRVR